ncbi:MAG: TldD/PmbA family protein [Deltaproteobacteria bacterium]|nr:TldD/PmbA family protein [Deltaproteobacteria bacterium]
MDLNLRDLAVKAVGIAKKHGASDAGVRAARSRDVSLEWRNGKVETVKEAVSMGLSIRLFVNRRYSANSTSDLRPKAIERFIRDSVEMTRELEPDPYRSLPNPALYTGVPKTDLQIFDANAGALTSEARVQRARELEEAARSVQGADKIVSVTTGVSDSESESVLINSNGFEGTHKSTAFWSYAEATVQGEGAKKPEDWASCGARFSAEIPPPAAVGAEASTRALGLIGAKKAASMRAAVIVENRCASRLAGTLLGGPLSASSLQQKRSFLEGKAGSQVGSAVLSIVDDPLIPKAFGSRAYDGEGIAARRLALFERGVLRNYYVDVYYGKKLGMEPTTGSTSNLAWTPGTRGRDAMLKDIKEGVLITSFLGGNSNDATGDFSFGIRGFLIKKGAFVHPVAEMNITGNHLEIWKRLVEVGNDPYLYSTMRCPSLLFEDVQLSGT